MRNHFKVLIAAGALLPIIATNCATEEYVVRAKVGTRVSPNCNFSMMNKNYQDCIIPSVANEATGPLPLWDANTFKVYTKEEMDKKPDDIEKTIKQGLDHNGKVLNDTAKVILDKIDNLPAELPMDAKFYKQMRERLRADIGAESDKAKQGVTSPAQ
jgi:hypothetical protein